MLSRWADVSEHRWLVIAGLLLVVMAIGCRRDALAINVAQCFLGFLALLPEAEP